MDSRQFTLQLTGAPCWVDTQGRTGSLSRKDAALLAILAWDGPCPRDRLAALLWPDVPAQRAHTSLRQRLFRLKRDAGRELVLNQALVSLSPDVAHDLQGQEALPAGDLLGGFDYGDASALDDWVLDARRRWRARQVDALTGQAARHEAAGQWAAAIADTQQVLALAPLQEHAWRRLMRLHYLRGDRAAAIAVFEQFEQHLRAEHGGRPSDETLEQLRQIESADTPVVRRRVLPASLVRPPRTVGRQREQLAMARAWQAGRAFVLIGAAGLGKSRLLDDLLAAEAEAGHGPALRAQGRPGDERSPYALVVRLLKPLLDGPGGGCLQALPDAYRRELARLLPVLGDVPSRPGHQGPLWDAVEQGLRLAVQQGWRTVVVDDLQFADDASIELLRWLVPCDGLQGLRFGLATRPAEGVARRGALADWWVDSRRPEPIQLAPLAQAEVSELITSLRLPDVHADLAAALRQHAGGEPFHLLETLKDLVLHGADANGLPRPATVATIIDRRLSDLTHQAQTLMHLAAVADADLTVPRAARILKCSALELAAPWAELEAQGVLAGTRFCHDLMREAALAQVPGAVRQALHGALAEVLADDVAVPSARLAGHWQAAGRWAEAGEAHLLAARAAHRAGRLADHGDLLLRAAENFDQAGLAERRVDALCLRLDSELVRLGGQAVVDQVAPLLAQATPRQRADLLQVEAAALANLARFDELLARVNSLHQACAAWPALQVSALCLHGRALAWAGQAGQGVDLLERAVAMARQMADNGDADAPLALALGHLGTVRYAHNEWRHALALMAQATELSLAHGNPADHAIHCANLASGWLQVGDPAGALVHAQQAQQAYRRVHAQQGPMAAINDITLAQCAAHQGDLALALHSLQSANRQLAEGGPPAGAVKAQVALAELWLLLGQPQRALARLAGAVDDPEAPPGVGTPWCDGGAFPPAQAGDALSGLWHFARASALRAAGALPAEVVAAQARAIALADGLPNLGSSPGLLRDWLEQVRPERGLASLDRLDRAALASGADGLARSLRLMRMRLLLPVSPAQALAIARHALDEVDLPMHVATHPLHAHAWLAQVFAATGKPTLQSRCQDRIRSWAQANASGVPEAWRPGFLQAWAVA